MSHIMDVIVVGCGASGVAALSRLQESGLKVLGLEAADTIGGRIRTLEFGDNVVDVGAAWCHGEQDNVVYELASPHGLLAKSIPDHNWYVQSNGELIPNGIAEEIVDTMQAIIDGADKNNCMSIADCLRYARSREDNYQWYHVDYSFKPKYAISSVSFHRNRASCRLFDAIPSAQVKHVLEIPPRVSKNEYLQRDPALTNSFLEWYERNNHIGGQTDPMTCKSLKGLEECWPCEGDFMLNWKGKGYRTILDVLLKKIPNPLQEIPVQILTNKEVVTIKWKAKGLDQESPFVHVNCTDGSLYAAKRVLVTMSIGVLKERHNQLFNPALPAEKINTINNLQLCVLDKIYIEFETPWWDNSPANFTILWRPEDKGNFTSEDKWVTEIYGFMTIDNQPNLLLAWIYGEGAKEMENNSIDNVRAGVDKLLKILFDKQYNLTPIKSILRSQWATNPLTRGAYSYRSVATEEKGGSALILSEPLYHRDGIPILCFGGEASSYHKYGAVHGAIEAGFREAKRIIDSFK